MRYLLMEQSPQGENIGILWYPPTKRFPQVEIDWSTEVSSCKAVQPHCKDKMPKIWNKYSQKKNIGASVPMSTFMCLWANYIFPRWVCLFCWRKYEDRSWEYINRSQTHEYGNWGWGPAIPRKGMYKRNCRCSAGENHKILKYPSIGYPRGKIYAYWAILLKGSG